MKSFFLIGLIVLLKTADAQQKVNESVHLTDHKLLMNSVWETFDMLMYKVTTEKGEKVYTPHFPPKLAAMNGKTVSLEGYAIAMKSGFRHNRFLLSVLPIDQCMFCGQDGIPSMVEVTLSEGKKIRTTGKPIAVKGKTVLNGKDKTRVEIWIDAATFIAN
ncbi:MAG: hypothetical protein LBE37_13495 [Sphingobacterium sp.]|jgi:hypothetical protein|nr:hypothetical protein [Sphingobacterium sp.]